MSDKNFDIVPIRFNAKDQQKLRRILDPEKKIGTQLKEIIFQHIDAAPTSQLAEKQLAGSVRLESLIRERIDKITSVLSMIVERLDEQEARLDAVGKDTARSRLVVENIQNYLAEEAEPG